MRRHGPARKQTYSVALDPQIAASLRAMGQGNLSAGIALAEFYSRGGVPRETSRAHALVRRQWQERGWIVFELVEGPADPLPRGEDLDAFREAMPL